LAVILLVGGIVLTSNANFAKDYVAQQMAEQKITFTALEDLNDEEKAIPCLVEYAGQPMTTGKQAECYANNYIGLHLRTGGGELAGLSYAEIGDVQGEIRAQIAAAQQADANADVTELQADL